MGENIFFAAEDKNGVLNGYCYLDFDENGWYDGGDGLNLNDLDIEFESSEWAAVEHYVYLNTPKFHGYFPDWYDPPR